MKKRVRDPEGKRLSLLEAGMDLADRFGLASVSVNDVAAEAGVGKGSFYVHFADRAAFLLELHRGFHEDMLAEVREQTAGTRPGRARMEAAVAAFLDFSLAQRRVRPLLLDIRSEHQVAGEVGARVQQLTRMFEQDMRAQGVPDPAPAARLLMAMCTEVAVSELSRGRRDNALRRSLLRLATGDGVPGARARR